MDSQVTISNHNDLKLSFVCLFSNHRLLTQNRQTWYVSVLEEVYTYVKWLRFVHVENHGWTLIIVVIPMIIVEKKMRLSILLVSSLYGNCYTVSKELKMKNLREACSSTGISLSFDSDSWWATSSASYYMTGYYKRSLLPF